MKVENVTPYVIVRSHYAGVFAGYLESRDGKEVVLSKARRIWSWDGACSLSEMAMKGVLKPDKCKFPCFVDKILVTDICEMIYATEVARKSIESVKEWTAKDYV